MRKKPAPFTWEHRKHLSEGKIGNKNRVNAKGFRGNMVWGEQCHLAKLTEGQVIEIRKAEGTLRSIASRYGITHSHVFRIKTGKQWKQLES